MLSAANEIKVFAGSANEHFAGNVCHSLGFFPCRHEDFSGFSDGEIGVSIQESVRGSDAYIIQPTSEPVNENLMELLIITDALKRASASRVNVVIPYFGYARQDRKNALPRAYYG
jgi:Phosphoribosylpyrophosphate synthetase